MARAWCRRSKPGSLHLRLPLLPPLPARLPCLLFLQGVGMQEVLRALTEAIRSNDKAGRQQLVGLLLRLFFYEELPPEAVQLLLPLFQVRRLLGAGWRSACSRGC